MFELLAQSAWADRIGWVLVHSLWQFALVALAAVALQLSLRRCSAVARYYWLLAAMSLLVAAPMATWFSLPSANIPTETATSAPIEESEEAPPLQRISLPRHENAMAAMAAPSVESSVEIAPQTKVEPPHLPPASFSLVASLTAVRNRIAPWLPEIVLAWFAGVVLAACRPLLSWYTLRQLRTMGVSAVEDAISRLIERTAQRLRLSRAVDVLQSTLVHTPVVVGYLRPVVLLPLSVATGLPESQLELILAHELAHIRRHDYVVNLLQTVVETLFFYHPAVWWLSRQIRNERENCCDDVAMSALGNRADYGRALLAIEELRAVSPALSLSAHGGSLLARIRRIAGCEPAPRLAGGGSILCAILASLAIVAAATSAAGPAEEKPTSSTEVGAYNVIVLAGQVTNGEAKPIKGATVAFGWGGKSGIPDARTDSEGYFHTTTRSTPPTYVSVEAEGYASLRQKIAGNQTLRLCLEKACTIRGRIVDPQGQPLSDIDVNSDPFFHATTDRNGRFVWRKAPSSPTVFCFCSKDSQWMIKEQTLHASDEEQTIGLSPSMCIQGTVKDGETGQPIKDFHLYLASSASANSIPAFVRCDTFVKNDTFQFRSNCPQLSGEKKWFKLEAEGYETVTREYQRLPGEQHLDIRLKQAKQPSASEKLPTAAISAEEFGKLSLDDQRAMLLRAFQQRVELARNLFYETEQVYRAFESNGWEPGKPLQRHPSYYRLVHRYWRLDDSYRAEMFQYDDPKAVDFYRYSAVAENTKESVGRNTSILKQDGQAHRQAQVVYSYRRTAEEQFHTFPSPDGAFNTSDSQLHFFQYLVEKRDKFEIKQLASGNTIQLIVPWQDGKQVFILDLQKGFLPIGFDAGWEIPAAKGREGNWFKVKFEVQESRLHGNVWLPVKMITKSASSDKTLTIVETNLLRIENGNVKPSDLLLPFTEGMQVADIVEGVTYTVDAQGNPADVKDAPNWKQDPPKGWCKGQVPEAYSLASKIPIAERKRLADEREAKSKPIDEGLKVLRANPPATQDERIEACLKILRAYRVGERENDWAIAIRELIAIGKPAVPKLIDELDRTERGLTVRAIGFVLRGINDPRAIPALIRAIPKMLEPSTSDYGLIIKDDPKLARFMQRHDNQHIGKTSIAAADSLHFSFGRPIREIMPTLEAMTGQSLGWNELNFVALANGATQQQIQRKQFLQLANRWTDWWSNNWRKFVDNEADAQLDRTKKSIGQFTEMIAKMPQPVLPTEIPCGPLVRLGDGTSHHQFEPYVDLDGGRSVQPPEALLKNSPKDRPSPELLAWAKQNGIDLLRFEIKRPGDGKTYYGYQPVGMKVWKIDNKRWNNLEKELQESKKLDLRSLWEGAISSVEQKEDDVAEEKAAAFLFITRDGACGAVRIRSGLAHQIVQGAPVMGPPVFEYRHIYQSQPKAEPGQATKPTTSAPKREPAPRIAAQDTRPSSSAADANAWKPGQTLDFRVVNAKTKEPLPDVKLLLMLPGEENRTQTTDVRGHAEIRLPNQKPSFVRIYPTKAGFVPLRVYWGDDLPSPQLPKTITVPMEPGSSWGGVVQNEEGKPISGVKVTLFYFETSAAPNPHLRVNIRDEVTYTDKNGRWRADIMPATFADEGPRIYLTHPDYISDHLKWAIYPKPVTTRPSYESLRGQTSVMVMHKGRVIEGRIINEAGKPIAGASICHQEECYQPDSQKIVASTDGDGYFRLSGMNDFSQTQATLTIKATGYAPELLVLGFSGPPPHLLASPSEKPAQQEVYDESREPIPLNVALRPGRTVSGQVVDASGKPIEGASVVLDYWKGCPRQYPCRTTTDSAGKFRIDDAPSDRAWYNFEKKGYLAISHLPMSPPSDKDSKAKDYKVTMKLQLRVSGSITDAATGKPPASCQMTKGSEYGDGRGPAWESDIGYPPLTITNGRYEINVTQERCRWIRVQAEGYMPAITEIPSPSSPETGSVTCNIKLRKAALLAGAVLGLDGQPLADAEVFLTKRQFLVKGRMADANARRTSQIVKTKADGRFTFPPEAEPFHLVVLHEKGHLVLTEEQLAAAPTVRIMPWTAENTEFLVAERKPPTHSSEAIATDSTRGLAVRIVDTNGKPVEGAIVATEASFRAAYNSPGPSESEWLYFNSAVSDSNGTARLPIASHDHTLVARHVKKKLVAVSSIALDNLKPTNPITLTMQPQCEVSGRLTSKGLESRNRKLTWTNVYVYMEDRNRRPMSCGSNKGDYHFSLPPGTYQLNAYGSDVQHAWKTITVKPGQEKLEVEPIDLPPAGLILLEGKPAPELHDIAAWKNGSPAELSNLRGKVVILAFSMHWSDERYHGIVPDLIPIYDKYRSQGLVVIEVRTLMGDSRERLNDSIATIKPPFWQQRDIPIPIAIQVRSIQRQPNERNKTLLSQDYGLVGMPTSVLIDRQGRVVGQFDPRRRNAADIAMLESVLAEKLDGHTAPAPTTTSSQLQPIAPTPPAAGTNGRILDHVNKPVKDARVFLLGQGSLQVEDGNIGWHAFDNHSAEGRLSVANDDPDIKRWVDNAKLDVVRTDADGRFHIAKSGKNYSHIIVLAPHLYVWAEPLSAEDSKEVLTIRLPQPATLKVVLDIPGAVQDNEERLSTRAGKSLRTEPVGRDVGVRLALMTSDMKGWPKVGDFVQTRSVANPGEVVFANLPPGQYDFARSKMFTLGDRGQGAFCDRQQNVKLGPGETKVLRLVRQRGQRVQGEVHGLPQEVPGAWIAVRQNTATADNVNGSEEWKLPTFDFLTCQNGAKFVTSLLEPGQYRIIARAFRPEPKAGGVSTGRHLPDFVGTALVTIEDDDPVDPKKRAPSVTIEMKPRQAMSEKPAKADVTSR